MAERNWKTTLVRAAGIPALGVILASCGRGDDNSKATQTPAVFITREVVTATPVLTPESARPTPTSTLTATPRLSPSATGTPDAGVNGAENFAVKLTGPKTWVEVANKEDLQGLSEFTIFAIVKVDGGTDNAIVAKGDTVESVAFYFNLKAACHDDEMALTVNGKPLCSGLTAKAGVYTPVAVTFGQGGKVKFYAGGGQSDELTHTERVPIEFGPLFIGLSPYGPTEGFNGEIDVLGILNRALSPAEVQLAMTAIGTGRDVNAFIATNSRNVVAIWPFNRISPFKDAAGNGHDGTVHGGVILEQVNK